MDSTHGVLSALDEPHTTYVKVTNGNAKCDRCDQRNVTSMQKCTRCGLTTCQRCHINKKYERRHVLDGVDNLDWSHPYKPPRKQRTRREPAQREGAIVARARARQRARKAPQAARGPRPSGTGLVREPSHWIEYHARMDAMFENAKGAEKSNASVDDRAGSNINIDKVDGIHTASEDDTYSSQTGHLVGPGKTVEPLNISMGGLSGTTTRNESLSPSPQEDVKTTNRKPLPTLKTAGERRMPNKRSRPQLRPGVGTAALHKRQDAAISMVPPSLPSSLSMGRGDFGSLSQRTAGKVTPIPASTMRPAPEFDMPDAASMSTQSQRDTYRTPAHSFTSQRVTFTDETPDIVEVEGDPHDPDNYLIKPVTEDMLPGAISSIETGRRLVFKPTIANYRLLADHHAALGNDELSTQYAHFATQALRLQISAKRRSRQEMRNEKVLDEESLNYQQSTGPGGVSEARDEETSRSAQNIQRPNRYIEPPQSKQNDLRYPAGLDADHDSELSELSKDYSRAVVHYTLPDDLTHQREILALVFEGARQTIGEQPQNVGETTIPGFNGPSPAQYLQPVRETQAQVAAQDSWADKYPAEFQREWQLIERLVYTWHSDAHIRHEKHTKGKKAALKMLETELHSGGNVPRLV
ncbi:hypothetical protein F5Y18DRAFT_440981 [Xylariaceae sp. FL1019]|nr:hypothetical protein F5Y18DRAFT_440981 [Xylariaceae sp. FL1019]